MLTMKLLIFLCLLSFQWLRCLCSFDSLRNGLVAYYPFDDDDADDLSGNNNHGDVYLIEPARNRFGEKERSFWFSGSGSYVEIATGNAFNFVNDFSFAIWIYLTEKRSHYLLSKSDVTITNSYSGGFSFVSDGTNNYELVLTHFRAATAESEPIILPVGQWFHFAIVKNDKNCIAYVNGLETSRTTFPFQSILSNGNLPLIIGAANLGQTSPGTKLNYFFRGYLDELYFYNRSLSKSEIAILADNSTTNTAVILPPSIKPTMKPIANPPSSTPTLSSTEMGPSSSPSASSEAPPFRRATILPVIDPLPPQPSGSAFPTSTPSSPTLFPSEDPTILPTIRPTSLAPSCFPSLAPSLAPSASPSETIAPSTIPTPSPSYPPTILPTTILPSIAPTSTPSRTPTIVNISTISPSLAPMTLGTNPGDVNALKEIFKSLNGKNWNFPSGRQWNLSTDPCLSQWYGIACLLEDRKNSSSGTMLFVNEVQLGNMNLRGSITISMLSFSSLSTLSLGNNQLQGNLPVLVNLVSIRFLNISNNDFIGSIPIFPSLMILDASHNFFDSILIFPNHKNTTAKSMDVYQLQDFSVSNNLLTKLPMFPLISFPFLSKIDVSFNKLSEQSEAINIPSTISTSLSRKNNLSLSILLSGNQFKSFPSFLKDYSNSITLLDLNSNLITNCPSFPNNNRIIFSKLTNLFLAKNLINHCQIHSENFPKLSVLDLNWNFLTSFPIFLATSNLSTLLLMNNLISSYSSDFTSKSTEGRLLLTAANENLLFLSNLKILSLQNNFLTEFPPLLDTQSNDPLFPFLERIDLSLNLLQGTIPSFLGNCEISKRNFLTHLNISWNELQGTLPLFQSCSNLQLLDLSWNSFQGNLPNFNSTPLLKILDVSYNSFHGMIPIFGSMENLTKLILSFNQFTGFESNSFHNIKNLISLEIGYNPLKFFPRYLDLPSTFISNRIPFSLSLAGIGLTELPEFLYNSSFVISSLDVSDNHFHNCTTVFNASMMIWEGLLSINLRKNAFQHCFIDTRTIPSLTSLDLSDNQLTAIPFQGLNDYSSLLDLVLFRCSNNQLTEFPVNLSRVMPNVAFFDFAHNQLKGSIPPDFSKLKNLTYLDLSFNELTGSLPSFDRHPYLTYFSVADNQLTGTFPQLSVERLEILQLQNNHFNSSIPLDLVTRMNSLRQFLIQNNYFHSARMVMTSSTDFGTLLERLIELPFLQLVNLSFNEFHETISSTLFQGTPIQYLDLRDNFYFGTLPKILSNKLLYLNVGNNFLSGSLSSESFARRLNSFYVNDNYFSGELPTNFLTIFTSLASLQLSNNYFSGNLEELFNQNLPLSLSMSTRMSESPIPPSRKYDNIIYFSVKGNTFEGNLENLLLLFPNLRILEASSNSFTGEIIYSLRSMKKLMYVDISDNQKLTGNLENLFDPLIQSHLTVIDLSNNQISGHLSKDFFIHLTNSLQIFSLSKNCISGSIPKEICQGKLLTNLQLAGLGSSASCRIQLLPTEIGPRKMRREGSLSHQQYSYRLKHSIEGSLPICLLEELPLLESLYISGNGLTGSFPSNLSFSSSSSHLKEFVFSYNRLTGSLPKALQSYPNWKIFDGSFNKLNGILRSSREETGFCQVKESLQLAGNRLSGDIPACFFSPSSYYSLPPPPMQVTYHSLNSTSTKQKPVSSSPFASTSLRVSILEGNLFSCQSSSSSSSSTADGHSAPLSIGKNNEFTGNPHLPHSDPFKDRYLCGSQAVDDSLIAWGVIFFAVLFVLLLDYAWHLYIRPYCLPSAEGKDLVTIAKNEINGAISTKSDQSLRNSLTTTTTGSSYSTKNATDSMKYDSATDKKTTKNRHSSRFEITKEFYQLCSIWLEEGNPFADSIQEKNQEFFRRFLSFNPSQERMTINAENSIPELLKTFVYLRWFSIGTFLFIFLVLLPIYGGFTISFRTHTFSYVWSISIGYLSGIFPSLFLLGIFSLFFLAVISGFHFLIRSVSVVKTKNQKKDDEKSDEDSRGMGLYDRALTASTENQPPSSPIKRQNQPDKEPQAGEDMIPTAEKSSSSQQENSSISRRLLTCWLFISSSYVIPAFLREVPWLSLLAYSVIFLVNLLVVFGASIGYVKLLNSNISAGERIVLQIAMAILKLFWSFFFIKRIFLVCLKNFDSPRVDDVVDSKDHLDQAAPTGLSRFFSWKSLFANEKDDVFSQENPSQKKNNFTDQTNDNLKENECEGGGEKKNSFLQIDGNPDDKNDIENDLIQQEESKYDNNHDNNHNDNDNDNIAMSDHHYYYNPAMSKKKLIFLSFLIIFNFVIAPIFAVAIFDANCFKYIFFSSPMISSKQEILMNNLFCSQSQFIYSFHGFQEIMTNQYCNSQLLTNEIQFLPPYMYSYQCTSTLLEEFVAIYIYQYCFSLCLFFVSISILLFLEKYHLYSEILTKLFLPKPFYFSILMYRRENSLVNPIESIESWLKQYLLPKFFFIDWDEMNILVGGDRATNRRRKKRNSLSNSRSLSGSSSFDFFSSSDSHDNHYHQYQSLEIKKNKTTTTTTTKTKSSSNSRSSIQLPSLRPDQLPQQPQEDEQGQRRGSLYFDLFHRDHAYSNKCFDGDMVVMGFMGDLILLLTFGIAFPPLAVLCTISIILKTKYQQLIIGRLLHELKASIIQEDLKERSDGDNHEENEMILQEMMKQVKELFPFPAENHHQEESSHRQSPSSQSHDPEEPKDPSSLLSISLSGPLDSFTHLEQAEASQLKDFHRLSRSEKNPHRHRHHHRWLDPEEYLKTFCYESSFFFQYFIFMGKYLIAFSAMFLSFFLFDILGDVLGMYRSIWIIPVGSFLPFLAWLVYRGVENLFSSRGEPANGILKASPEDIESPGMIGQQPNRSSLMSGRKETEDEESGKENGGNESIPQSSSSQPPSISSSCKELLEKSETQLEIDVIPQEF